MRKKLKEKFKAFMWNEASRGMVRWEVLLLKEEEGGVGLREPICALDAAKIRMLVSLMIKDRQPWMKWIERKLNKVAKKWGVQEAMAAKPNKKQLRELKEDCIVESTLKIWFEIGGKGGGKREEGKKEKRKGSVDRDRAKRDGGRRGERRVDSKRETDDETSFDRLVRTRMKLKNYEPKTECMESRKT